MIKIRRATEFDAQALTDVGISTFVETFAKDNRREDMDDHISKTFSTDMQLKEIQDPKRIIEIAWSGDEAAGYLHMVKGNPDPSVKGPKPIEILRIYVDSRWHGKGVGAQLMERAIQIAREVGCQTLWLGVWERNPRAQAFYRKYGLSMVGKHVFRLGSDVQTDVIMTRSIED